MTEEELRQKFVEEQSIRHRILLKREAYRMGYTQTAFEMLKNLVP